MWKSVKKWFLQSLYVVGAGGNISKLSGRYLLIEKMPPGQIKDSIG